MSKQGHEGPIKPTLGHHVQEKTDDKDCLDIIIEN